MYAGFVGQTELGNVTYAIPLPRIDSKFGRQGLPMDELNMILAIENTTKHEVALTAQVIGSQALVQSRLKNAHGVHNRTASW
jgi:hypothetical protein